MRKWLLSCLDAKPAGGSKIMAQEQISKSYNTDNRERFGTTDPLGGFIADTLKVFLPLSFPIEALKLPKVQAGESPI